MGIVIAFPLIASMVYADLMAIGDANFANQHAIGHAAFALSAALGLALIWPMGFLAGILLSRGCANGLRIPFTRRPS